MPEDVETPPHLLFIAFFFPPSRASGVYRALAITNAFAAAGWKVTVVTTTKQFFLSEIGSVDESLMVEVRPSIEVIRVPFSFWRPPVAGDIRAVGWVWGNLPTLRRYLLTLVRKPRDLVRRLIGAESAPRVSETYSEWIEPVVEAALDVHIDAPFDHILATGNPYSSFEAARLIGEATHAPFSVDFRDPWTFDLFTGRSKDLDSGTYAAERRIIESSTACFHVNSAIADAYIDRYPATATRHHVVPNGFDAASIGKIPPRTQEGSLTFGMIGTITDVWPLEPIFEAWARVLPDLPEGSRLLLAGHLGYFDNRASQLRETVTKTRPGFEYLGSIKKGDVARFYEQLDVVLVPVPRGEMVTSGKIYEALGLGIPLVCIQARGGGARALLGRHPAAIGVDPNPRDIGSALIDAAVLASRATVEDVEAIRAAMKGFERSTAMRLMVDVLTTTTMAAR